VIPRMEGNNGHEGYMSTWNLDTTYSQDNRSEIRRLLQGQQVSKEWEKRTP